MITAKKLRKALHKTMRTQTGMASDLDICKQQVNSWCTGRFKISKVWQKNIRTYFKRMAIDIENIK